MTASWDSDLPQIAKSLDVRTDVVAGAGAKLIADGAKARVAIRTRALHDSIHVERKGQGHYSVVAGNRRAFYGHLVEFGGGPHNHAQPFLIPAFEAARPAIEALGHDAFRDL